MAERPTDWPGPGPIDLAVHDLPHRSSTTEWWYLNAHVETVDGRKVSVFASFFRIVKGRDEATKELRFAHSVTWSLSDADGRRYHQESVVDRDAPEMGKEKLKRGEGSPDPRLRRALKEVLDKGRVPWPDRMFRNEPHVGTSKLELDFDGHRFFRRDDGTYCLVLHHHHFKSGCEFVFRPTKAAIRHGDDGLVKGIDGGDMFYYFVPRCEVTGTVTLDGVRAVVAKGIGWYDHEFGGHQERRTGEEKKKRDEVAWNWCAVELDDGTDISAYTLVDLSKNESLGQKAVTVSPSGERAAHERVAFEPLNRWRSTRSFNEYPTRWKLEVPDAAIDLELTAAFDDQEFITLVSKPAFWEGRVEVSGRIGDRAVSGLGYVERSGFLTVNDLDGFFSSVGKEVRKSVAALIPLDPTRDQVRDLIASKERDHYMEGVDSDQLVRTMCKPVREITDRGGKAWRSYAALACCDVVGGDSRRYVRWLAMPELMHVGSLIVDDVQDKSTWRRGGPTTHLIYGEAQAINAGTACYFMGQKLLDSPDLSSHDRLRVYDFYFEALRAGHAGQAMDLDGLAHVMPEAIERGDSLMLERRVLAVHRLKTAAPAGALARMGAVAGHGTQAQVDGVGNFFEQVGLAFQVIDDVLNLRGFKGDLKSRGEDISHGKVTMPVAKSMSRLPVEERRWMWETVASKPTDPELIAAVIDKLERCGAIQACEDQARSMVDEAWARLDPLVEDSIAKLMLRAFGWYVLERHY